MNRRTFLKVAGAVSCIEFGQPEEMEAGADFGATAGEDGLASLARSLPSAGGLAAGDGIEYSVTRLDGEVTKITETALADAMAYGTVFAGPTAVDVAVGLPDARAVRARLRADGYDVLGTHRGWTILDREARTRHRTAAVSDSTAVLGVSPVVEAVRNDVRAAIIAITRPSETRSGSTGVRERMFDNLGSATHISIDVTPDPRRTAESVVATGEQYALGPDRTMVRSVTLFDSVATARVADLDDTRQIPGPAATDGSVDRRGRVVVRDATVSTDLFVAAP